MKVFNVDGKLIKEAEDVLYEIGNVGVATAVIPIGNIREMEFRVGIPHVFAADMSILDAVDYTPEQMVIGVNTKMHGSFSGSILFLLSENFVQNTVEIMLGEVIDEKQLLENEDSVSAIQEIINYMTAGYVKVIGTYLNEPMFISEATIGVESVKDILSDMINKASAAGNQAACVNTRFSVIDQNGNKTNESGQILIFPGSDSIEELIRVMEENQD